MTLLMSGASSGLHSQDRRIIALFDADAWFVADGASGPFTTTTPVPAAAAEQIAALPGVTRATPVVLFRSTVDVEGGATRDVNIIALPPGGLGEPTIADGRALAADGEALADTELSIDPGSTVSVGGRDVEVVGTASGVTYYFGTPTIFVTLDDAQAQFLGGQPLATAIVVQGEPDADATVPGLTQLTPAEVRSDLARPSKSGDQTIQFINVLLWIVAAGIIGSIVYLSSLERSRDFAVMKATGASDRSLLAGLAIQAVVLSALAAIVAILLAQLLAPGFPFVLEMTVKHYITLLLVSVLIGLVASAAGLRRAVRVDPALAFGGG